MSPSHVPRDGLRHPPDTMRGCTQWHEVGTVRYAFETVMSASVKPGSLAGNPPTAVGCPG